MAEKYVAYAEYKDSGVKVLGDIPTQWKTSKLAYTFLKANAGEVIDKNYWGSGKEILYTCNRTPLLSDYVDFPEEKRTTKNDLLLTRNGTPYVHKPIENSIYSNVVQRITLSSDFSKDYLKYCLGNSALSLKGYGVSIESFNFENWKSMQFAVPSMKEQIQIANFLDFETAQIDTLIDKQQTLIQLLKEKRQAVISHAVTKGLNPDAPMKESGVEWLGEVPEHWAIPQIGYHSKVTKLTGFEYTNLWRPNMEGKIIALRGFNIQERYLDLSKTERITEELSNKLARSKLYEGDIVLPCTGTLGNAALIQENNLYHINHNIAKVTINSELFNPEFTVFWMTSLPFRQMIDFNNTSGMQPVLLIGDIRKLPIPLLPLDEQQKIVDFLLLKTEQFDRLIDNAQQAIQLMQERRTALISAAVTGKIDVRGWQAAEQS